MRGHFFGSKNCKQGDFFRLADIEQDFFGNILNTATYASLKSFLEILFANFNLLIVFFRNFSQGNSDFERQGLVKEVNFDFFWLYELFAIWNCVIMFTPIWRVTRDGKAAYWGKYFRVNGKPKKRRQPECNVGLRARLFEKQGIRSDNFQHHQMKLLRHGFDINQSVTQVFRKD